MQHTLSKGSLTISDDGIRIVWQDLRVGFNNHAYITTLVRDTEDTRDLEAVVCEELSDLGFLVLDEDQGYCTHSVLSEIEADRRAEAEHVNSYRSTYFTKANLI